MALVWVWAFAVRLGPGLDTLDYHACLLLSPVVGVAAGHLTLAARGRRADWWWALTLCLGPLAIYGVGALARPWCAPWTGLAFYLLGPLGAALVGTCAAALARRVAGHRAVWVMYGIWLLISVRPAWHFATSAQVSAWHGLLGGFAGPLYEDAVALTWPWVSFRLLDLGLWLPAVAGLRAARGSRLRRTAAAVLVAGAAVAWLRAGPDGWHVGEAELAAALPVEARVTRSQLGEAGGTEAALVLHLPGGGALEPQRSAVAQDAAVRWVQLRSIFGQSPRGEVHVYVYPDGATRGRLMGASQVDMAKPWLRQVHIALPAYGASVLKHELAHVFAGAFAPPPFRVPLRGGWMPDALLIEGVATAAEWPRRSGLDPHQQARAMRRLGLAPRLQTLLSTGGFLLESGPRAYTLAGSFVRWVQQSYGQAALIALYRTADAEMATGQPLPTLIAAWERFVDSDAAGALTEADMARARARFERPGLLFRPCVLEAGRSRERARRAWLAGNMLQSEDIWTDLAGRLRPHLPQGALSPDLRIELAAASCGVQPDRPARCRAAAQSLDQLADTPPEALSQLQRAALLAARGDLRAQAGDRQAAVRHWRAALSLPVGEGFARLLRVQLALIAHPAGERFVRQVLAIGRAPTPTAQEIEDLVHALPDDPVAAYLQARHGLLTRGDDGAATRLANLAGDERLAAEVRRACRHLAALHAARRGRCAVVARMTAAMDDGAGAAATSAALVDRCRISGDLASRGLR